MANTKLLCIFFLVAISNALSDRFVAGRSIGNIETNELVKYKGTVKTIEVIIMHITSFLIILLVFFFFLVAIYFSKFFKLAYPWSSKILAG